MNRHLELLCMQSAARLVKHYGSPLRVPAYRTFFGLDPTKFSHQLATCVKAVRTLIAEGLVSEQEVYEASDIGRERLHVVDALGVSSGMVVVDVGCGRGYTTFAAAIYGAQVVGVDLMNGGGRQGWWHNWLQFSRELAPPRPPLGLRADILAPPIRDDIGVLCLSVHAIRNLPSHAAIVECFRQMARIAGRGGTVAVAECLPLARTPAQEAHLRLYNLKVAYSKGDLTLLTHAQLEAMMEEARLKVLSAHILDLHLAATPPIFWINPQEVPSAQRHQVQHEFEDTIAAIHEHGETSPPVLLLTAAPQSD